MPQRGRVGRPGRPWRAARTLAPFPAGGPAAFCMGVVVAGRRAGGGEGDEEGTAGGERLGTPGVWGEEGEVGAREKRGRVWRLELKAEDRRANNAGGKTLE